MKISRARLLAAAIIVSTTSGCASYRTDSNITSEPASSVKPSANVLISEGSLPNQKYKVLGPIEVSVKKLTIFHKDPTKELANEALAEKARTIGADAVIDVTYKSGVGFTTWGYIDANGTGVKFAE